MVELPVVIFWTTCTLLHSKGWCVLILTLCPASWGFFMYLFKYFFFLFSQFFVDFKDTCSAIQIK